MVAARRTRIDVEDGLEQLAVADQDSKTRSLREKFGREPT
jgi:hypothetical protein